MSSPEWCKKILDDNPELLQGKGPLLGRIRIESSAWRQSDAEFERALEYEIRGMQKDVLALRSELLRRMSLGR